MDANIYYFSASGNSLAVARGIARELKANLIPIPSLMDQDTVKINADVVGIVFPVYYAEYRGVPLIVWRFIQKLQDLGSKYVFAVATHGGGPGSTIEHLAKHIAEHDGRLAGGFTVKMAVPYSPSVKMRKVFFGKELDESEDVAEVVRERQQAYDNWKRKLETITRYVSERKEGTLDTQGPFVKTLVSLTLPLRRLMFMARYRELAQASGIPFYELVPLADRSFRIADNCNSCGVCAKVCPVENIEIVDGKPCFKHHCETCMACFQWCPEDAISGKIVEYERRFHHPEVKLADFIDQRSGG